MNVRKWLGVLGMCISLGMCMSLAGCRSPVSQRQESEQAKPAEVKRIMEPGAATVDGCIIEKFRVVSTCMNREIKAVVVLPPGYQEHSEKKYPILYTLHGMGAPYDCWSQMSPLRRALAKKPMIVVCMDGDADSFYLDSPYPRMAGRDTNDTTKVTSLFTTFFLNEFIPCLDQNYRVDTKNRMLTGFSMGGWGAFHYMLTKPAMFSSVSSLSGAFQIMKPEDGKIKNRLLTLLGPQPEFPERYANVDFNVRIQKCVQQGVKLPPLYLHCGMEDHLLGENQDMRRFLTEQGVACEYRESAGSHDWKFWRDASADVIDFHWRMLR